jgi:hypothetical protein
VKQYATAATYDVFDSLTGTNIESILITNRHASTSQNVTVYLHTRDGLQGTIELFPTTTLTAGQQLSWHNGFGWNAPASSTKVDSFKVLTTNWVNALAATPTAITGFSWPVVTGHKYGLLACLNHIANANTNGPRFYISGVAVTLLNIGEIDTVTNSVTASTHAAGTITAVDTAFIAETAAQAANGPAFIGGGFIPSADGTMVLQGTGEDANAAALTVLAGSWAWLKESD